MMYGWLLLPFIVIFYLWGGYALGALLLRYAQKHGGSRVSNIEYKPFLYRRLFPMGFPSDVLGEYYAASSYIHILPKIEDVDPPVYCGCIMILWPLKLFWVLMTSGIFGCYWIIGNVFKFLMYPVMKFFNHIPKDEDDVPHKY